MKQDWIKLPSSLTAKKSDCSSPTSVFERILVDYMPSNVTDDLDHAVLVEKWAWSMLEWAWL